MYPYMHIILPSYTVMAFVGGFFSLIYVFFRLEKYNIKFTTFVAMFIFAVIGGVLGSKILYAITQLGWLFENFSLSNLLLLIPQSGFVFYGGLFGVICSLYIFTRKDSDYRKRVFRMIVPAMPLFHAFGRIGCFFAGCCYGKMFSQEITFMGITFERIPIQLIEAILEFILFAVLVFIDYKKQDVNLLKIYLLSYAIVRFVDEFFRGDRVRGGFLGISTSQWISIGIFVVYAIELVKRKLKSNSKGINEDICQNDI